MAACRSCRSVIVFHRTPTGALMPLDPEPRPDGNVVLRGMGGSDEKLAHVLREGEEPFEGELRFRPHFASCTASELHRRRSRK